MNLDMLSTDMVDEYPRESQLTPMHQEGKPLFIQAHQGVVKGVAFSPKERYIFCSGGTDGKVNVYNALYGHHIMSAKITNPNAMRNINAVKFNADGSRILSTTSKRLSVIDPERGELICSYDNCAYAGRERAPLASDPRNPHLAICGCTNGKGLITFDLRKQQPARFALNVHSNLIRDVMYLDQSWPFCHTHQSTVVSLSCDGVCKIRTEERELHVFDVKHLSNSIAASPDIYSSTSESAYEAILMIGGESLSGYIPGNGTEEPQLITYSANEKTIQKLKYTSNGHLLYAITSSGNVRRYRRMDHGHQYLGVVYSHNDGVLDMDISPNDEYLITGCCDGTVGLLCCGTPSYGWTGFMELA